MSRQPLLNKSVFHFVGIGGIGMCGLAELLHNMGAVVTGSDRAENAFTEHLKKMGIAVFKDHRAENVGDVDVVVYSSAVPESNEELQAARQRSIPVITRGEALAEIMRLKRGIAVAGTHGKTTTTSMLAAIFLEAQLKPTIFVGARLDLIQSTALLGSGEWLIAEADESDGSFHKLTPEIAIITNIDNDHLDHYNSFQNLKQAFFNFAQKTPFYGAVVVCGDDPAVREVFASFPKRLRTYGFDSKNDYHLRGANGRYEVFCEGKKLGDFALSIPGRHNALNALGATVVGIEAGLSFQQCAQGLLKYSGVDRRFHLKGEAREIAVYDDYGHHPTEVRATLQAFREKFPNRQLKVYFQPHRYSRTESCWNDFLDCFESCDQVFLGDIYPAGEAPREGITSEKLAKEIRHRKCVYVSRDKLTSQFFSGELRAGDVFLTLGAGDGWKLGLAVLETLRG